jgi:hypothetical protein
VNKTTAIFLIDRSVRCIAVAYDKTVVGGKVVPTEVKSFKSFDSTIEVDDLVVIPTDSRWGFTIGKVVKTDLHVDFDSPEQMRWIASKIDVAEYQQVLAGESGVMDKIADADRAARQQKLAEQLTEHVPGFKGGFSLLEHAKAAPPPSGSESDATSGRGGAQT